MLIKLYELFLTFDRINRKRVIWVFILSIFGSLLEILGLGLIYPILNFITSEDNSGYINNFVKTFTEYDVEKVKIYLLIFFALFIFFKNIALSFITYFCNKNLAKIRNFVSVKLFSGYLDSDYNFFVNSNSGELTKNLTSQVHSFNLNVVIPFGMLLTETLILIIFSVLALSISFTDTLFIIIFILIPSFVFFKWTKLSIKQNGINNQKNESLRIKRVIEMIGSIRDIKILNKEEFFLNNYSSYDWNVSFAIFKQYFITHFAKFYLESVLVASIMILCFINIYSGKSFLDLIPLLGFYAIAAFRIMPSVSRILNSLQMLKFGEVIVDGINSEFKRTKNLNKNNQPQVINFKKSINLKNVSFRYQKKDPYVLKNINFNITNGEMIGIYGQTGEGKSTLINIILGLLKPTNGNVTVDNKSISRKNIFLGGIYGYVPQDIFLLDDTIKNNIAFGLDEKAIDYERVLWAAKEARLYSFIQNQKKGIDSLVGDKGIKISGGQKQRIGIARALYYGAKIIIFDEATSALDEKTEMDIIENITCLKRKYTIIMITHRLKTLKFFDKVFKLSCGDLTLVDSKHS